ncbi:MAG: pantoate--beta-alanine ligase [Paludibacteraceae bacterium]|nr:pantoate--beta-alanine ligase [Paludibacteraceae bacterium]
MYIVETQQELRSKINEYKQQQLTIGLVPTMGALHEGHLTLIKKCLSENDITVVSIFVNPTQFNNAEDLIKYPRNLAKDAQLLEQVGVDIVFAPSTEEMYDAEELNSRFAFDFNGLDTVMEGAMRPGHFNGVVQIVSRLFHLVTPNKAYFGEKDFQQLAIIRHMTYHSSMSSTFDNLTIVGCPIVRETSGLALSSRNERLSEQQKNIATNIYKTLNLSKDWANTCSVKEVEQKVIHTINSIEGLDVEYYCIVDKDSLQATNTFHNAIGCITVYCGDVRLIDNIQY